MPRSEEHDRILNKQICFGRSAYQFFSKCDLNCVPPRYMAPLMQFDNQPLLLLQLENLPLVQPENLPLWTALLLFETCHVHCPPSPAKPVLSFFGTFDVKTAVKCILLRAGSACVATAVVRNVVFCITHVRTAKVRYTAALVKRGEGPKISSLYRGWRLL
jgi:hypothetical protein